MKAIYVKTRDFFYGKISSEEYKKRMLSFYESLKDDVDKGGIDAYSFYKKTEKEIEELEYCDEEENMLKTKALVCDIFNNLAHALKNSSFKTHNDRIRQDCSQIFGMKKGCIFEIIKECRDINNSAFGIKKDVDANSFVVDIPMVGQVCWHLPNEIEIKCQEYPYEIHRKDIDYTNLDFLTQSIKQRDLKEMDEHIQMVMETEDIETMLSVLDEKYRRNIKEQIVKVVGEESITEDDKKIVNDILNEKVKQQNKGVDVI